MSHLLICSLQWRRNRQTDLVLSQLLEGRFSSSSSSTSALAGLSDFSQGVQSSTVGSSEGQCPADCPNARSGAQASTCKHSTGSATDSDNSDGSNLRLLAASGKRKLSRFPVDFPDRFSMRRHLISPTRASGHTPIWTIGCCWITPEDAWCPTSTLFSLLRNSWDSASTTKNPISLQLSFLFTFGCSSTSYL